MSSQTSRIMILDSIKYGLSPAAQKFSIAWVGTLSYANLHIDFDTSFGYGLTDAYLNGTKFIPKSGETASLDADVRFALVQGGNSLTIDFAALQILGVALGSTTITAYIDYYGGHLLQLPSLSQEITNIETAVSKNYTKVIIGVIAGAAVLGSIAYIASRLPSAGGMKASDIHLPNVSEHLSDVAKKTHHHIKHALESIRGTRS